MDCPRCGCQIPLAIRVPRVDLPTITERNGFGQATGYNIEGITENKPVYLDFEQVAAVVRVYSDEKEGGGGE